MARPCVLKIFLSLELVFEFVKHIAGILSVVARKSDVGPGSQEQIGGGGVNEKGKRYVMSPSMTTAGAVN